MICKSLLYVVALTLVFEVLLLVNFAATACTEDFHCAANRSTLCCFGVCRQWWKCKGGCLSDDSCEGGKFCYRNRCTDENIVFPEFCKSKEDCGEGKECESNQCKPLPQPVADENSSELHREVGIVVIIGTVVGVLMFLLFTAYCSYRCIKRRRRRFSSRRTNSHPSAPSLCGVTFSASRNRTHLYQQPSTFPQRPPPPYDSVTLDSNLEETSSPPPYAQVVESARGNANINELNQDV